LVSTATRTFDHLIGAAEQRNREGEAERLGGFEVEDQLDFHCLLDRQVGRLGTVEAPTWRYPSARSGP
jgi:hypothetical protein